MGKTIMFLLFLIVKASLCQIECDLCLEVGAPGDFLATSDPINPSLVGTYRFQGQDPLCPDGCAYSKDGNLDTWCFAEGSYPATATCPATQATTPELTITVPGATSTTTRPASTSSALRSTSSALRTTS